MYGNEWDVLSVILVILVLLFVGLIALAVVMVKRSSEIAKQSEVAVMQIMHSLPGDKQMLFSMQFNSVKKDPTVALLLNIFLGGFGGHKFYMGQSGTGIFYLLFSWTLIPPLIAFFELFGMAGNVGKYNYQKALEIASMLGGSVPHPYL